MKRILPILALMLLSCSTGKARWLDTKTDSTISNAVYSYWHPSGRTIYFCRASRKPIPDGLKNVRYNLCSVDFDPQTGEIGESVTVIYDAASEGKSVSFPKPSYDGRFLMYTLADYGQFTRPYFSHISQDGNVTKPFMLPQEDPMVFYHSRFLSFNVAEFVTDPVKFNKIKARKLINSDKRKDFGFRR